MLAFDRPAGVPRLITRMPWFPVIAALASVVAVLAVGKLAANWLDVYLVFFGDQPQIEPSNVAAYRVWGAIACVALICGAVAHMLNPGRRTLGTLWQVLLVLGCTAIAVLCYIPGAVDLPAPERDDDGYRAPPCYSGGDNDECVGG
ncbi:hypothetical protein ACFU7D_15770 [Nocardioides sp. NPDC057577]|uniref:hypothetical protein n=1 Tax=Nocardioides sp. NPDC057577 TaxID=3346171 RepID=UPI00367325D7